MPTGELFRTLPLSLLCCLLAAPTPTVAQVWNLFGRRPAAEKAQAESAPVTQAAPAKLTQQDGPWLILATTFSGEGAERQAEDLADELRAALGLDAYVHPVNIDHSSDGPVGLGVDKYGAPLKMRYRSGDRQREWAVLVGDFPSVDDPVAAKVLTRIKQMRPEALSAGPNGETAQSYARIREAQRQAAVSKDGKSADEGPMRTAFVTRNPLLPAEYFVPKGVDKFVASMNKPFRHSLLEAPGKYTVRVATFRGRGQLVGAASVRSSAARRRADEEDSLAEAGANAHLLCEEMRAKGWDAYEFHDRDESYVTVGSWDTVSRLGQDAPLESLQTLDDVRPEVAEVIRAFGARYDTPSAPLEAGRGSMADRAKVEQVTQTFHQLFTSEVGQVATGLNPKYAQVSYDAKEPPRPIPFDIHPVVIEAPRKTVSASLGWRR